ncbi:MAG: hypothetical protein K2X00_23490 [Nitrospiraceae bacterium]|jgi:hypothetical protein|uniref:hypothetical protein n=1 Tax=Pseudomonas TaxID=286 RepID=UPI000854B1DA|nr:MULTISPECIES: hypothetical protein [Pseudomonas]MBX9661534.1 hypothetical protein [Nitrospiraceae bacterium]OEO25142.1 hypothetical protein AX279_13720 [Pseudomonas sp. J237]OOL34344.1 hypothetical protein BOO94_29050 [Pseudomonas sp. FSL W5-0299]|tara:strand:- start:17871 stop:18137 length:267 start_codon:yes stop_codon:yes gene_type:complete
MDNRNRFLTLLKENGITQAKSAVLIAAVTQRPCSPRTVRSWVNDPEKASSTPCPDWAVAALEKAIEFMKRALQRREEERQAKGDEREQ